MDDSKSTTKSYDLSMGQSSEVLCDDYNPFLHRSVANPNSSVGSLIHIIKGSLGMGILAMPMAFKNAGLLLGLIGTFVVGIVCTHCVHILVVASHNVCRKTRTPSLGFAETVEMVFQHGPKPLRRFSTAARFLVTSGVMSIYVSACTAYIVLISSSLRGVLNQELGLEWSLRLYIICVTLGTMAVGQIRELKYLTPFSMIANILITVVLGIVLYFIFGEPLHFADRPLVARVPQMPYFFATAIFAMEGIGAVMPIENQMSKPQQFLGCPGVLNVSMITITIMYAVIGFLGFVRYGDAVKGSITLNLPIDNILATVAQYLIAIAIFFTFGLLFYIPSDIVWQKIKHRIAEPKHNLAQITFRCLTIALMGLLAIAVPNLDPIIGLVGSVFLGTIGLFVPAVVETVNEWPRTGRFHYILIKNALITLVSIFLLIFGSIVSFEDIAKEYIH